jgi:copper transport protein
MGTFVPSPRLRRGLVAVAAVTLVALAASAPAGAHSFLIRSDPAAGARLTKEPAALTLYFSEPFVRSSEQLSLRRIGGANVELPAPTSESARVLQPLPASLRGVFVVHWRVLSDDGHISLGEFAFAVRSAGVLPSISSQSQGTSWSEVVASWLLFIGLALALGGLVSERVVWHRTPARTTVAAAPVAAGLALAAAGGLSALVLLAANQRGGGLISGLHGGALADVLGTRPGKLTLATVIALAISGVLTRLRWLRVTAIVPIFAAVILNADRGHSGTSGYGWAVAADSLHLAAVAIWLGALAHLVVIVARADAPRPALVDGARRYSRFALPTVLVVLATGVLTAIPEFRSVGAVFSSGYGQTLLVKSGLIGVALLVALVARQQALPANPHPRLPLLRRLTLTEATTLAVVLIVAAVLVNAAPPRASARASAATSALGPPPVAGPALRLADLAGQLVVAVTAGARELQFTVLPPGSQPPGKLKLSAEAGRPDGTSADLYPRPCGSGCFSIRFPLRPGVTVVTARVSSNKWKGGEVRFALPWPLAPERPALVRRVGAKMRALPSLSLTEQVTSGPGSRTPQAAYSLSGRQFMQTEVFGGGAVDVHSLGTRNGSTQFVFAVPGSNIWYRIWVDRRYRLRRELIIDPGHRIFRTFRYGRRTTTQPSAAPSTVAPTAVTPPPPDSVVLGQEDGDLAVGLAVTAGRQLALQATVLGPDGNGLGGLDLVFRVRTTAGETSGKALACGSGCYRTNVPASGTPLTVTLSISGRGHSPSTLRFSLPERWPPPGAATLVARATHVFRRLLTLVTHERLASSPANVLNTTYEAAAPNRLAYQIAGGPEAIIIGDRRWDRDRGGKWQRSSQTPLQQPAPFWTSASDAHVIGTTRVGGRSAWLVSFYDLHIPAFFTIAVDKTTLRTLDLRMTAAAHFMHHRYSSFNSRLTIKPPHAGR